MKKDIEWFKKEFEEIIEFRKQSNPSSIWDMVINATLKYIEENFKNLINQLDEPEILSQEWISDHIIFNEKEDAEYIYADKLQNLLVPKQEEMKKAQIPDWIVEWYQGANSEHSKLEDIFDNLSHDIDYNIIDSEKFRDRIMEYGGYSRMREALAHIYFGAYEIEEEQKYYVVDKNDEVLWYRDNKGIPRLSGSTLRSVLKSNSKDRYQFTEQEIKDFDPRYWAFAVKVEEVE